MRRPAIHICFVCHQGKPFLPSQPKSLHERQWASASLVRGQSIPLPLAVALGGGHKMQTQQTWRPGLAQGIFEAIRRYVRKSADRLVPRITFSWTRKMAQRRGPSRSWKRPNRALPAITLAFMLPKLPRSQRLHGDTEGTAFESLKSKRGMQSVISCIT